MSLLTIDGLKDFLSEPACVGGETTLVEPVDTPQSVQQNGHHGGDVLLLNDQSW